MNFETFKNAILEIDLMTGGGGLFDTPRSLDGGLFAYNFDGLMTNLVMEMEDGRVREWIDCPVDGKGVGFSNSELVWDDVEDWKRGAVLSLLDDGERKKAEGYRVQRIDDQGRLWVLLDKGTHLDKVVILNAVPFEKGKYSSYHISKDGTRIDVLGHGARFV